MRRIALVAGHAFRSGVPSYVRQVCEALAGEAEMTVISDADGDAYDFAAAMGVAHVRIPGLARSRDLRRSLAAARALGRALDGFDVVWAGNAFVVALARLLHARAALGGRRRALVAVCHGAAFGPGRKRHVAALGWVAEMALLAVVPRHDVVFVSTRDRAAFPAWALRRHDVRVIPNTSALGRPPDWPRAAGERATVVMTTRAAFQKNLAAAIAIAGRLPPGVDLVLVGEGTERFGGRGIVDAAAVRDLLAGADAYLMTSRYEGLPIGALEAFELGLPIAMTDVGGADEIGRAHPLFALIDTADPAAAAAAVARLVAAYRADREAAARRIAAASEAAFAPDRWRAEIRALAAEAR